MRRPSLERVAAVYPAVTVAQKGTVRAGGSGPFDLGGHFVPSTRLLGPPDPPRPQQDAAGEHRPPTGRHLGRHVRPEVGPAAPPIALASGAVRGYAFAPDLRNQQLRRRHSPFVTAGGHECREQSQPQTRRWPLTSSNRFRETFHEAIHVSNGLSATRKSRLLHRERLLPVETNHHLLKNLEYASAFPRPIFRNYRLTLPQHSAHHRRRPRNRRPAIVRYHYMRPRACVMS